MSLVAALWCSWPDEDQWVLIKSKLLSFHIVLQTAVDIMWDRGLVELLVFYVSFDSFLEIILTQMSSWWPLKNSAGLMLLSWNKVTDSAFRSALYLSLSAGLCPLQTVKLQLCNRHLWTLQQHVIKEKPFNQYHAFKCTGFFIYFYHCLTCPIFSQNSCGMCCICHFLHQETKWTKKVLMLF